MRIKWTILAAALLAGCTFGKQEKAALVELAVFRLKPGVSEQQLLKAADNLQQEFLSKQGGCLKRELVKQANGEFADILYWQSAADAQRATQLSASNPACQAYFELLQEAGPREAVHGVIHYAIIKSYE